MSAQRVNGTPEPEHQPAGETPAVGIAELELPPGSDVRQAQERVVEELLGRPPSMAIEEEIGALRRVLASEDLGRLGEHLRELEERLKSEEAKREETADFVGRLSQMANTGKQILVDLREHKLRALVGVGTTIGIGVAVLVALKRSERQGRR